jgi:hypothetical protein
MGGGMMKKNVTLDRFWKEKKGAVVTGTGFEIPSDKKPPNAKCVSEYDSLTSQKSNPRSAHD